MERLEWAVPRSLDEIPQFLFLDLHQLIGVVLFTTLGLLAGSMLGGLVLGLGIAKAYARLKAGRHSHFVIHLAYWHLPAWVLQLHSTPPAYQRIYLG